MQEEFNRGHDIVNALWKRVVKSVSAEDNQEEEIQNETAFFAELFELSDFLSVISII